MKIDSFKSSPFSHIDDLFKGYRNFANKTFANRTFANGESTGVCWRKHSGHSPISEILGVVLAKVQWTFANWRNSSEYVGETTVDFRQWRRSYWRKSYWRNSGTPSLRHESDLDIRCALAHSFVFIKGRFRVSCIKL
jgi:hypothetical protein